MGSIPAGGTKEKSTAFPVLFSLALPRERTASVAPVRSYSELSSASVRSAEHFSGNANATERSGVFPLGVPDVNNTNPEKSGFVLFFSSDYFGIIYR